MAGDPDECNGKEVGRERVVRRVNEFPLEMADRAVRELAMIRKDCDGGGLKGFSLSTEE